MRAQAAAGGRMRTGLPQGGRMSDGLLPEVA